MDVPEGAEDVADGRREGLGPGKVQTEQAPELAGADDEGRRRCEPADDRMGQEVDQGARSDESERELDHPDGRGQQQRERRIPSGVVAGDHTESGGGQQRHQRHRTDCEVGTRAQQGVDHQRGQRGIQAGDR
jgi:hypothetical protein